ncbi:MAG: carbon-nitrogen hydrolase family protein [Deltaproteobacteria bacterium]|nr:carbon-nitrogen hydrolase family protein [Deltaproteobacteria bacterium]
MSILVAAAQMTSRADVAANVACAERLIQRAAQRGAALVGLPENFAFMGANERDKLVMQEALDGPIVQRLQRAAAEARIAVILGGFQERSVDPERPYNTCLAIDAHGNLSALYRKIHLFDIDLGAAGQLTESSHTSAGDRPVVVDLAGLRVGLSICYDLRFGDLYAALVDLGANLLAIPAAFTLQTGKDHWEVLQRARAIEFQSYVLAPAQQGLHNERRQSYGHAMIVDPWGTVLARCPDGEGICFAEVDLQRLAQVRDQLPALRHRRPDVFPRASHGAR